MSTYYYLACEEHKEYVDGCSDAVGGVCHLGESEQLLPGFIYKHRKCVLKVVSEHDDIDVDPEWTEFSEDSDQEVEG